MAGSSAAAARARARRAVPKPEPRCGAATPTVITYRRAMGEEAGSGGGDLSSSRRTAMAPTKEGPRKAGEEREEVECFLHEVGRARGWECGREGHAAGGGGGLEGGAGSARSHKNTLTAVRQVARRKGVTVELGLGG